VVGNLAARVGVSSIWPMSARQGSIAEYGAACTANLHDITRETVTNTPCDGELNQSVAPHHVALVNMLSS
jgi:hypothetical protein